MRVVMVRKIRQPQHKFRSVAQPCAVCGRSTVKIGAKLSRCCIEVGYIDPNEPKDALEAWK